MKKIIKQIYASGLLLLVLSCAPSILLAQKSITWKDLADVDFESKYNKEFEAYFLYPKFGKSLKELEGQEISIKGYILPLDVASNFYVLSAEPMASCFFCGGSGPESIIELELSKGHRRFKTDERLTFKGKLKLNANDVNHLNYILTEAKVLTE